MTTMLWQFVEALQLMILVHGDVAPTDTEWSAYSDLLQREYRRRRVRRVLVFGDGPGPKPSQRKTLHHIIERGDHPLHTAVLAQGVVARGIVTALNLFYEIRAFPPTEMADAFEYLGIPEIDWYMVKRIVATFRDQLSTPAELKVGRR
jgi:hypothetical protein